MTYKLPSNLVAEIGELQQAILDYTSGRLSHTELKVKRLGFGTYEQRESGTYMVRVRCAAGVITPDQLLGLSELAVQYGNGILHLTTREEVQLHYVRLEGIIPVARALLKLGLTNRGGGGNTVRNIIIDEYSGIAPDEIFDVTPYAIALTSRLIAESDSWTLPRKFKIAFSSSDADRAMQHWQILDLLQRKTKGGEDSRYLSRVEWERIHKRGIYYFNSYLIMKFTRLQKRLKIYSGSMEIGKQATKRG